LVIITAMNKAKIARNLKANANKLKEEAARAAEVRRVLLATLDPETRALAIREFAKLGLKQ